MGNKTKMILKKKVITVMLTLLISGVAQAQTVVDQDNTKLPNLSVNTADDNYLLSQSCDPNVMRNLNNEYLQKRQFARNSQLQTLVKDQVNLTPPPQSLASGSCFEKAANSIDSVMSTVNAVRNLFSGNLSGVGDKLKKAGQSALQNAACQQINNYTGAMTSGLSNGINSQVNGTIGQINNYNVGTNGMSLNGGQLLKGATGVNTNNYQNSGNNGVPYITGNQIQGTVNQGMNTLGGSISTSSQNCSLNNIASCNPFK